MTVISVENIGKRYRLGAIGRATIQEDFARWWAQIRRKPDPGLKIGEEDRAGLKGSQFWALRNVSFAVSQGEVLGIIGRNGAGKSTLLKILSQITSPTTGHIRIRGRLASLLEVGTGFHPELTGRENVFLNGAILGMTKNEITRKLDAIIAFSEMDKFIDTPVKRYSSGMYVRLAFAVAAHLDPEILLIDEVLAVGDAAFQKKCLGKMGEVATGGRTVLFVSHNLLAVQSLCQRCVFLDHGKVLLNGDTSHAVSLYLQDILKTGSERCWEQEGDAPGNEFVKISRIAVRPQDPEKSPQIKMQSPFQIETEYWVRKKCAQLHITYHLLNEHGIAVLSSSSEPMMHEAGNYRTNCRVPGRLLNSGAYFLKLLIVEDGGRVTYQNENIASFHVLENEARSEGCMAREPGVVRPKLLWHTIQVLGSQADS
jgi:lipopolysaccharide transport system ATP-binding protein